jgi:hypothetical protein
MKPSGGLLGDIKPGSSAGPRKKPSQRARISELESRVDQLTCAFKFLVEENDALRSSLICRREFVVLTDEDETYH